jgi:hypothetical protein
MQANLTNLTNDNSSIASSYQNQTVLAHRKINQFLLISIGEPTIPHALKNSNRSYVESDIVLNFHETLNFIDQNHKSQFTL